MKKFILSKPFVFSVILFCVIVLFSVSSFATDETTFDFTGFDGDTYSLPSLPDGVAEYKQYVFVKNTLGVDLLCFNDILSINKSGSNIVFDGDNSTTLKFFKLNTGSSSWKEFGCQKTYSYSKSGTFVIYSSSDLLKYGDSINSDDGFFFQSPIASEIQGTLAPIYQTITMGKVLQEIVEILPIVLMIIVGLIGLRKALKMLSRVLHQS